MPSFPIAVANVTATNNGTNLVVTNGFKTVTLAQTHGQQRPAVIRVISYRIQNASAASANVSFADSSGTTIQGPFVVLTNTSLVQEVSAPAFLFETTRTNIAGYDLIVTTNSTGPFQCEVEWTTSFVPGRVGA